MQHKFLNAFHEHRRSQQYRGQFDLRSHFERTAFGKPVFFVPLVSLRSCAKIRVGCSLVILDLHSSFLK